MTNLQTQSLFRETLEDLQFTLNLSNAEMAKMLRHEAALLELLAFAANPSEGDEI